MKFYEVTVSVTGYQTLTVMAVDEDGAEELALEYMNVAELQVTEQYACTVKEVTSTAHVRRMAISRAVLEWMNTTHGIPDEHDIDLEAALILNGVLQDDDVVEEIWSDSFETLMIRLDTGTLIEIDSESGNSLRGEADD